VTGRRLVALVALVLGGIGAYRFIARATTTPAGILQLGGGGATEGDIDVGSLSLRHGGPGHASVGLGADVVELFLALAYTPRPGDSRHEPRVVVHGGLRVDGGARSVSLASAFGGPLDFGMGGLRLGGAPPVYFYGAGTSLALDGGIAGILDGSRASFRAEPTEDARPAAITLDLGYGAGPRLHAFTPPRRPQEQEYGTHLELSTRGMTWSKGDETSTRWPTRSP
jgi:hypothetical protein